MSEEKKEAAASRITRWEYTAIYWREVPYPLEALQRLGLQGWELVGVAACASTTDKYSADQWFYFKRPLPSKESQK